MRKLLIIVCLFSTVFTAIGWGKKKQKNKELPVVADSNYRDIGAKMPPLRLVNFTTKRSYTNADFANDANLFLMEFNPTCGHCQDEALLIEKNLELFSKTKIVFLAAPNMGEMFDVFENVTKVSQYPKIHVGLDSSDFITKTFRYEGLPQISIYNKERKLIKVFNGDTPIDSLKKYIE